MQPFPPSPSTRAQFSWWLYAAFGILQPRPLIHLTPSQFKHCLRRAKNVVVTFNCIHIFCLPNVPRNPTSYKADGSTWLCLSRSLSLPFSVLHTFLSFCLVGVAHKLSFRFLANCAKCTKMLNTCQLPSSKSVEVPKWGLCYTRKGARWRRLPRLLRTLALPHHLDARTVARHKLKMRECQTTFTFTYKMQKELNARPYNWVRWLGE